MAKKDIVWTETALRQRREILRYWTLRNKSTAYAEKLIKLIAARIKIIAKHPDAFKVTTYPETRISAMATSAFYIKNRGSTHN